MLVCREILAEYYEKLQTKLGLTSTQASRAVAEILTFSTLVEIERSLHVVLDDPDDDKVIECAEKGNATYYRLWRPSPFGYEGIKQYPNRESQ